MANLNNEELSKIENEIAIINSNHCHPNEIKFTLTLNKYNNNTTNEFYFNISGNNNENFKGKCSNSEVLLYTQYNEIAFYLKSNDKDKKEIFKNKFEQEPVATVKSKSLNPYSFCYTVEFFNMETEKNEYFEMIGNDSCDIFYNGDKQNNAPMISRITKSDNGYEISITSGVDYLFIIGLASLFFYEKKLMNNSQDQDNSLPTYDSIARLSMPTVPPMSHIYTSSTEDLILKQELEKDIPNVNTKRYRKKRKPLYILIPGILCCCFCCDGCCCCRKKNPYLIDNNQKQKNDSTSICCLECVDESFEAIYDIIDEDTNEKVNNNSCCCCCHSDDKKEDNSIGQSVCECCGVCADICDDCGCDDCCDDACDDCCDDACDDCCDACGDCCDACGDCCDACGDCGDCGDCGGCDCAIM